VRDNDSLESVDVSLRHQDWSVLGARRMVAIKDSRPVRFIPVLVRENYSALIAVNGSTRDDGPRLLISF